MLFFNFIYVLELWLDWIKDEIVVATTDEEKQYVITLCEKGVKDYLSKFIILILLSYILLLFLFMFVRVFVIIWFIFYYWQA